MIKLRDYQLEAIQKMKNGCILCGGVGSGKSLTSLGYYYLKQGGDWSSLNGGDYMTMDDNDIQDLYIITTARKRDTFEWEKELAPFLISTKPENDLYHNHKVIVDSWNNIKKYSDIKGAFFIFDEQRVIGSGAWVDAFLKISKNNNWILLSATPGDTWEDYIPVFIANGFYKNRTAFIREHVVYNAFLPYRKIDRYLNTGRLIGLRNNILVDMDFKRNTISHHESIWVDYNKLLYQQTSKERWNPYTNEPIKNATEFCVALRRIINEDESRQTMVLEIMEKHPKAIVPSR